LVHPEEQPPGLSSTSSDQLIPHRPVQTSKLIEDNVRKVVPDRSVAEKSYPRAGFSG
jgi:hypothetical protein